MFGAGVSFIKTFVIKDLRKTKLNWPAKWVHVNNLGAALSFGANATGSLNCIMNSKEGTVSF